MLSKRKDPLLYFAAALGFGLLQGARFLDPSSGPYSQDEWAVFGLFVDGITFLTVALLSYYAKIEKPTVLFLIAAVATIVYVIASLLGFGTLPLIQAISGLGWALNILCWMAVFTSYNPKSALALIVLGYLIDVALKPIASFLGGDIVFWYTLSYIASIVFLLICLKNNDYIAQRDRETVMAPPTVLSEAFSRTTRAVLATAALSFVCGFAVRSDALIHHVSYAQTDTTAWMCIVVAILMLVVLLAFKVSKANMDYIVPIAGAIMGTTLIIKNLGVPDIAGSSMVCVLITFYVLLWLMFVSEAHSRQLPAFFLLGLALASARLSVALGQICASALPRFFDLQNENIALLLVWFLLITACVSYFGYLRYANRLKKGVFSVKESGQDPQNALPILPSIENAELAPTEIALEHLVVDAGLSKREADVIREYAIGRSSRYIADLLMISEHTVKTHLRRAYVKLDIHSRQDLLDTIEQQEATIRIEGKI